MTSSIEKHSNLVLSRRVGEVLVIGNDIYITILAVRGAQVKLGIDAPRDVPVLRKELLDKIMLGNDA